MDGREKNLFKHPPIRLSPENVDKVTQDVLIAQQSSVDENEPFCLSFKADRGWIVFKNDKVWYRAKIGGQIVTETDNEKWKRFRHFSILDVVQDNGSSLRFLAKLDHDRAWEIFTHIFSDKWLNDFHLRLGREDHWSNEFRDLEVFSETDPNMATYFESINECLSMPQWSVDEQTLAEWQDFDENTEFYVVNTGYWQGAHKDDPFPDSVRKQPGRKEIKI